MAEDDRIRFPPLQVAGTRWTDQPAAPNRRHVVDLTRFRWRRVWVQGQEPGPWEQIPLDQQDDDGR